MSTERCLLYEFGLDFYYIHEYLVFAFGLKDGSSREQPGGYFLLTS